MGGSKGHKTFVTTLVLLILISGTTFWVQHIESPPLVQIIQAPVGDMRNDPPVQVPLINGCLSLNTNIEPSGKVIMFYTGERSPEVRLLRGTQSIASLQISAM